MPDALGQQIEAYEALLADIKREHGSVWVIVAGRKLVSTFKELSSAVRYANTHYGKEPVLIRHTDERRKESAPFVQLKSAK